MDLRESRQKRADGCMVHCLVDKEGCAVVGKGLCPVHVTTTATAPLSGASAFTTCTFSPNTAEYVVNSQVHSTSLDVARTNSNFHSTPPSPGSPGATEQKEGQTRSMALGASGEHADGWRSVGSAAVSVRNEVMDQEAPEDRGAAKFDAEMRRDDDMVSELMDPRAPEDRGADKTHAKKKGTGKVVVGRRRLRSQLKSVSGPNKLSLEATVKSV